MQGVGAQWVLRPPDVGKQEALVRELSVSPLVARLLVNRGLTEPAAAAAFLDSSLSRNLRSPMLFREMRVASGRLAEAVHRRERIVVYGDYDVDGITGSTQLLLFLRELGVEPELFIPHRMRDGYGLRAAAVQQLATRGGGVMITVDCGAAAHEEIALAASLGFDVIVCDHHQAPEVRPPAFAVLNPVVPGAGFPFAGLCAAGVVFYLLMGLRMVLREGGNPGPDLRRYLDLVALGTIADLVPLLEENRVLVKHGLREIARTERVGMRALRAVAGVGEASVGAVGFGLAPRLNASGRLADATRAVELLATTDPEEARRLAQALDAHNRARRDLEEAMFVEATRMVDAMPDRDQRRSFVLASEGWHPGVVGIVASRLVERYARPFVLLATEGEWSRGSARSVPAVHLFSLLKECAPLLERFGGHRMAAGLTLRTGAISGFAERFEEVVRQCTVDEDFRPAINVDTVVDLADVSAAMADDLARLEPHGPGNPRVALMAEGAEVLACRIVAERHLKLSLRHTRGGPTFDAIAFRMAERQKDIGTPIDIVFWPSLDNWEGHQRLQLEIRDFRRTIK